MTTASAILGVYTVTDDVERLDRIAKRLYGTEQNKAVERLLAANNGLAAIGPYDPRNTQIVVPAVPAVTAPNPAYVRPWE